MPGRVRARAWRRLVCRFRGHVLFRAVPLGCRCRRRMGRWALPGHAFARGAERSPGKHGERRFPRARPHPPPHENKGECSRAPFHQELHVSRHAFRVGCGTPRFVETRWEEGRPAVLMSLGKVLKSRLCMCVLFMYIGTYVRANVVRTSTYVVSDLGRFPPRPHPPPPPTSF